MSHENESITLNGNLQNKRNKDLDLVFKEVDLNKISPSLEKFKIDGILNGKLNILQKENIYQPNADVNIENLKINNTELGKLNLDISGDDNLEKFRINSLLRPTMLHFCFLEDVRFLKNKFFRESDEGGVGEWDGMDFDFSRHVRV